MDSKRVASDTDVTRRGDDELRLFVSPHHPDQFRIPEWGHGSGNDPTALALTWNTFRTFELLPPAIWLRRLNARAGLELPAPAPSIVRVRLWRGLRMPAAVRLTGGPATARADAVIETEHAVWSVLVSYETDLVRTAAEFTGIDPVAALAQATTWVAGRRRAYVVVVTSSDDSAPLGTSLVKRYASSQAALRLRLSGSPDVAATENLGGLGTVHWSDLKAILQDCAASGAVDAVERALVDRTTDWMTRVLP